MILRKLTLDEVQITFSVEPEENIAVEGHFQSDEPEKDREQEQLIVEAVNAGYVEAWCTLVVTAKWQHWEGIDALGAVSFEAGLSSDELAAQVKQMIDSHGMPHEALVALQKRLETDVKLLSQLKV